jgi:hypothetical protein
MAKNDTMGEVIKWVLILGGGYLAYEYIIAPMLATPATPAPAGGTTGGGTTGGGTTGSGGSGSTSGSGSGSGSGNSNPPPPPTCTVPISHTCPDGTVITQMPTNPPACNLIPDQGWSKCPVPSTTTQTQNVVNAGNLAQTLNARAITDGVHAANLLPAATGYPNGQVVYTPQQWNYIFNELYPKNTQKLPTSSQLMSAADYTLARATAFGTAGYTGLSGLGQLLRVGRQHLRTGGRAPIGRNYVRSGTPMRRAG